MQRSKTQTLVIAALLLGPAWGALVGAVGHFLTALTSGFPLTLPVHLLTCVAMALTMAVFAWVKNWLAKKLNLNVALVLTVIAGALCNGPVCLVITAPLLLPMMGLAGMLALAPALTLVGGLNAALAALVFKLMPVSITGDKASSWASDATATSRF